MKKVEIDVCVGVDSLGNPNLSTVALDGAACLDLIWDHSAEEGCVALILHPAKLIVEVAS